MNWQYHLETILQTGLKSRLVKYCQRYRFRLFDSASGPDTGKAYRWRDLFST